MNVIPSGREKQISFATTHVPAWGMDPESIGLGADQVADIAQKLEAAKAAWNAAHLAREAAEAATLLMNSAVEQLTDSLRSAVRCVKAYALSPENDESPAAVFGRAMIPEPKNLNSSPHTPPPPPGRPESIAFTLLTGGAVRIAWEASGASTSNGAYFVVSRRLPGENSYKEIGVAPGTTKRSRTMSFVDSTLPHSAAAGAVYQIEGRRGDKRGETSIACGVSFGRGEETTFQRDAETKIQGRAA